MGIELTISLDKDIRELNQFFDDLKFKAITTAARQGLNRAASRTRSMAIKEIRKRRKVQLSDLKGSKTKGKPGFVTVRKAKGSNIAALEAQVNFSGIPLPMILFIIGQKAPKAQTVANPKRRARRFEVVKGQKKRKPGLFVQKAQRGKTRFQVFRRGNPSLKSAGFKLQTAPSVSALLNAKRNILRKIENTAIALMQREYDNALRFQLSKLKL